jgi:hypothetical protein
MNDEWREKTAFHVDFLELVLGFLSTTYCSQFGVLIALSH